MEIYKYIQFIWIFNFEVNLKNPSVDLREVEVEILLNLKENESITFYVFLVDVEGFNIEIDKEQDFFYKLSGFRLSDENYGAEISTFVKKEGDVFKLYLINDCDKKYIKK
uniref:hypothetical protein n=1 Tax=Hydrocytium acuminatum TaxID=1745963 RepID=UPI002A83BF65|nr:hypothetical protein UYM18_pgp043 [Hydrocytium acuminatum]WOR09574.1 hypothetical protein [Hydrocytium acuminatum]